MNDLEYTELLLGPQDGTAWEMPGKKKTACLCPHGAVSLGKEATVTTPNEYHKSYRFLVGGRGGETASRGRDKESFVKDAGKADLEEEADDGGHQLSQRITLSLLGLRMWPTQGTRQHLCHVPPKCVSDSQQEEMTRSVQLEGGLTSAGQETPAPAPTLGRSRPRAQSPSPCLQLGSRKVDIRDHFRAGMFHLQAGIQLQEVEAAVLAVEVLDSPRAHVAHRLGQAHGTLQTRCGRRGCRWFSRGGEHPGSLTECRLRTCRV